jgi:hypothetical protein
MAEHVFFYFSLLYFTFLNIHSCVLTLHLPFNFFKRLLSSGNFYEGWTRICSTPARNARFLSYQSFHSTDRCAIGVGLSVSVTPCFVPPFRLARKHETESLGCWAFVVCRCGNPNETRVSASDEEYTQNKYDCRWCVRRSRVWTCDTYHKVRDLVTAVPSYHVTYGRACFGLTFNALAQWSRVLTKLTVA